jgi:quercetin dioxygenase-like cupin family protein
MPQNCISWNDIPEEVFPSGVSKREIQGEGVSLVMVRLQSGTRADRHNHPYEQFVQVITGGGVLETEQGAQVFGPGSVFHFPPNTWHAARFERETVLIETNLKA